MPSFPDNRQYVRVPNFDSTRLLNDQVVSVGPADQARWSTWYTIGGWNGTGPSTYANTWYSVYPQPGAGALGLAVPAGAANGPVALGPIPGPWPAGLHMYGKVGGPYDGYVWGPGGDGPYAPVTLTMTPNVSPQPQPAPYNPTFQGDDTMNQRIPTWLLDYMRNTNLSFAYRSFLLQVSGNLTPQTPEAGSTLAVIYAAAGDATNAAAQAALEKATFTWQTQARFIEAQDSTFRALASGDQMAMWMAIMSQQQLLLGGGLV